MKNKKLVIYIKHGGLGDHLFFSHIPRIAKESGLYEKVYVSNRSEYRNDEIKKLIWSLNPYVDGFSDDVGFDLPQMKALSGCNVLDQIMLTYGLDDGVRYHDPEVYYSPDFIHELSSSTLFDPNYISNIGIVSNAKLLQYLNKGDIQVSLKMAARDSSIELLDTITTLSAENLFAYCDIIASCANFICMTSGGATLAAALKKPATVFYGSGQSLLHRHSKLHTYVDLSPKLGALIWFFRRLRRFIVRYI